MMSCRRARDILVEHVRGQVGEPTLLQLDQHLADCTACRAERARWGSVAELRNWTPPTLGSHSRERIVARLRTAGKKPASGAGASDRPGARIWTWAVAGTLAAATLGAGAAWRQQTRAQALATTTTTTMTTTTAAHALPERVSRFGGAELRIAGGSDVELRPAAREIALGSGALELSAPVAVAPLHVRGPQFEMVLTRAHARFASDAVRVLDGAVEVYALDGRRLATVGAGGQWPAATAAPTAIAALTATAVPSVIAAPAMAPSTVATTATTVSASAKPHVAPSASDNVVQARLDRARSRLADGDAEGARSLIRHALAGRPSTAERAQAQIFVAESYLVESDPDRALTAYAEVARAFPRAAEGEAAAFAAAQLYSERGRHAEAEAALRGYLDRYPDGQFAREARDRLAELRTPLR
jgi:TolA-binding protein